jgi:hypothetical protein
VIKGMKKQQKAVKSKPKKRRAVKYETKLSVQGSFANAYKVIKKNKEDDKNH